MTLTEFLTSVGVKCWAKVNDNVIAFHQHGGWYYFCRDEEVTFTQIGYSKKLECDHPYMRGPVCATVQEWESLNDNQKKFLEEAAEGGMRYLIHEKYGYPYAWGVAIEALFSQELHVSKNDFDGYVVMLCEDYDKLK
jgi:hypothetical protein